MSGHGIERKCCCGGVVVTTILQIPACQLCHDAYTAEGEKNLPFSERVVLKSFIDRARAAAEPMARRFSFYGY